MTKPKSVILPRIGNELRPEDAPEFHGFFSSLMDYLQNPEPNTLGLPQSTAPNLTKNGQVLVSGSYIYFRSNNTTYRILGTT